jgi:putative ABC transport system permease protein
MKFLDCLRLALQNLWRVRFRTFLTILGVIIGISAIVLFVSLGLGLQIITTNQIAGIDALTTLTISQTPATTSMEAGPTLTDKTVAQIKNINGVSRVSESVNMPGSASIGQTTSGAIAYGIRPQNSDIETNTLSEGKALSGNGEAIISSALATASSDDPKSLIGQEIDIAIIKNVEGLDLNTENMKLKISGIENNDTTNIIYTSLSDLYTAGGFQNYSSAKVKVKDRNNVDSVQQEIQKLGFQITTIKDLVDQINKIFLLAEIILGFVGGIGLIVSSLGIVNTMTISLLERTHEIGIMKAIGAADKDIKKIFYTESALIGLFGGTIGVALAVLVGYLFNLAINYLTRSSSQQLELFVTPWKFAITMMVFAIFIALFSGVYPAYRAKRLVPIDALRQ